MAETTKKGGRKSTTRKPEAMIFIDGRMPPQSPDFEVAVLGAILLEPDAYSRVSEILSPEMFYVKAHEEIYRAMTKLSLDQRPLDYLQVSEELRRMEKLEEVGGMLYLTGLTQKVMSASHIESHAMTLAKKALSRRLIGFSSEILKDAYDDVEDVAEQLQRAEGKLFEIAQNKDSKDFQELAPLLGEAMHEIQQAANQKTGISGLASGFRGIDEMTSGWQNSDLIIIAARPAMGKTAFVVSMARNMTMDYGFPVALFNLEMSAVQLVKRVLSNVCEIDGQKIKSGRLSDDEWKRLTSQLQLLESTPLYINDTPSLSVFELRSKARRLVRDQGVRMIIIDYLQLMNASGMGFGNREQEVSIISRSLKMLAKELKIPIIALSQLNRGVENRQGDANSKRPQLSDLRESGAIEQDADIVCFIHRPEYYKITQDPTTGADLRGIGEFIIAKHRNGPVGDVRLRFKSDYAKFTNENESPFQRAASSKGDGGMKRRAFGAGTTPPATGAVPPMDAPAMPDFDNPGPDPLSGHFDKPPFAN